MSWIYILFTNIIVQSLSGFLIAVEGVNKRCLSACVYKDGTDLLVSTYFWDILCVRACLSPKERGNLERA